MSQCYEFPICLPNPENLYMPDPPVVPYLDPLAHSPSPVPMMRPITYPGLFCASGDSCPLEGFNFIPMGDKLRIQALFAAGQFLNARCKEQGLVGIFEANPYIVGEPNSFACLHSELSLLGAGLGHLMSEMALGPRRVAAQAAFQYFATDLKTYAPWFSYPEGAASLWTLIRQSQATLYEAYELTRAKKDACQHFDHELKRSRVSSD